MHKLKRIFIMVLSIILIFTNSFVLHAVEIVGGSEEDFMTDIFDTEEETEDNESNVPLLTVPPLVTKDENGKNLPYQIGMNNSTEQCDIVIYEQVAQNDKMILYADMNKGLFALKDVATDYIWYSTPQDILVTNEGEGVGSAAINSQLLISYVSRETESATNTPDIATSYSDSVAANDVTVEKTENGVLVEYRFDNADITIPVAYSLNGDEFSAKILVSKIKEGKKSYLVNVTLLPTFAAANQNKQGYIFVPDGSGALVDFKNHRTMDTSMILPVYGNEKAVMVEEQKNILQQVHMPVFGTVHGNNALMGIIKEGDGAASLTMNYSNNFCKYTSIGTIMHYRIFDHISMFSNAGNNKQDISLVSRISFSGENFTVAYRNLSGNKANYVGMAEAYREYLVNEKGLTKHTSKPSFHINLVGMADVTASFFGFEYTKTQKLTTYKQAEQIVKELMKADIKQLSVRYTGWNNYGISNNKMIKNANPSSKLGGNGKWKNLSNYLEKSNIPLYPNIDMLQFKKGGNGFSIKKDATHTAFGRVSYQYRFKRSVYGKIPGEKGSVLLRPTELSDLSQKLLKSASSKKLTGVGLSKLGEYNYSDLKEKNGVYRDSFNKTVTNILKKYSKQNMNIGLDTANSYAAVYADCIWNMPLYSSGYDIYMTDVPFYQLVFHGYVNLTTPSVMQSANSKVTVLKAVETGSELMYNGIYENAAILADTRYSDLYSSTYTLWMDEAAKEYKALMPYLNLVCDQKIIAHREIQSGVMCTEFENGVKAYVNYSEKPASLPEGECGSMDYLIITKDGKEG